MNDISNAINSHDICFSKYLPPKTKLGQGNAFTGICDSVNRGSASVHAGIPPPRNRHPPWEHTPPGADPPGADPPWEQTPPRSRHLPEQTPPLSRHPPGSRHSPPPSRHPPRADTPWHGACWEVRSTRGRYASYWNAILFQQFFHCKPRNLRIFPFRCNKTAVQPTAVLK